MADKEPYKILENLIEAGLDNFSCRVVIQNKVIVSLKIRIDEKEVIINR